MVKWLAVRDQITEQIMTRGWNPKRRRVRAALRLRRARRGAAADAAGQVHRAAATRAGCSTLDAIGSELVVRQPRLPLQPEGLARRLGRRRGHVLDVHVLVRRGACSGRPPRRGAARVREDADLRQPPRPVRRGDRPDRRGARQLPAGLHAPVADQRRGQPRPPARARLALRPATAAGRCPPRCPCRGRW